MARTCGAAKTAAWSARRCRVAGRAGASASPARTTGPTGLSAPTCSGSARPSGGAGYTASRRAAAAPPRRGRIPVPEPPSLQPDEERVFELLRKTGLVPGDAFTPFAGIREMAASNRIAQFKSKLDAMRSELNVQRWLMGLGSAPVRRCHRPAVPLRRLTQSTPPDHRQACRAGKTPRPAGWQGETVTRRCNASDLRTIFSAVWASGCSAGLPVPPSGARQPARRPGMGQSTLGRPSLLEDSRSS